MLAAVKLASIRPHIAFWALRLAWVVAIALWGVALVPWFRAPQSLPPEPVRLALNDGSPQFQFPSQEGEPPANDKPEPVFVPQRPRAAEAAAAPGERAPRTDVCGFNDSGAPNDGQAAAFRVAHVARQGQLGLHAAFDELRARSEPQAQAAAWWLRVVWAREGGGDTMQPCAAGTDCPGGAPATALPPVSAAVDALAQLALASHDAWAAQIAARACEQPPPSAVCSSLPPRRWVALEPDNAAAWLEQSTRDTGPVDESLQRALRAPRFDTHRGRLAAWVLQAMPDRAPPMQRYAAWQRAEELERAADAKALAGVARHCSDSARRDSSSRAQICDALARWLQPEAARSEPPSVARGYDCPTIERQWREARDAAQRGVRVTATATAQAAPQRP
jgi:hypothetical protein